MSDPQQPAVRSEGASSMSSTVVSILAATVALIASTQAAAHDLSGSWSYSTSKSWNKGPCPAGREAKGTIKISVTKKKTFTLVFESGRVCKPKSMCTFKGKVKGNKYVGSNKATVDTEGGKVTNTITLTATSEKAAKGSGTSKYVHPGGMTCRWGSDITLKKK
jgi:hypothetical protein